MAEAKAKWTPFTKIEIPVASLGNIVTLAVKLEQDGLITGFGTPDASLARKGGSQGKFIFEGQLTPKGKQQRRGISDLIAEVLGR